MPAIEAGFDAVQLRLGAQRVRSNVWICRETRGHADGGMFGLLTVDVLRRASDSCNQSLGLLLRDCYATEQNGGGWTRMQRRFLTTDKA